MNTLGRGQRVVSLVSGAQTMVVTAVFFAVSPSPRIFLGNVAKPTECEKGTGELREAVGERAVPRAFAISGFKGSQLRV